ncbi:hypothetical protein PMZ80_010081 [Knufia obscura]|uniref:Uncharacterized protein n=2 Tax=Knufia TaxID=430999 RepID=A0AAN8IM50_9EURO|nr:hypothetical protein PMZ80_010081 [Knufia obscura]KAK5952822.1 hypothetical protein OHC33_005941 [Knufia fluminis]
MSSRLQVRAARPGQMFGEAQIKDMTKQQIKDMVRGKKIHVFIVNEQGVLIRIRQAKTLLKGLSVISTVVKRALVTHNKRTNYATVNEIVLPTDDI